MATQRRSMRCVRHSRRDGHHIHPTTKALFWRVCDCRGEAAAAAMESSMDSLIMFCTRLMSAVLAGVISSSLGLAPPASATEGDAAERGAASVQLAQACGILGPYATIRRANEVAYEAGSVGYSTQVFHNGDGYYVRAC
jgi:hypothetical protein